MTRSSLALRLSSTSLSLQHLSGSGHEVLCCHATFDMIVMAEAGAASSQPAPPVPASSVPYEAGPSSKTDEGATHCCPFGGCDKRYAKASKLAQHVRSHTGERPFICDHPGCGASYMRNEHLKAHQRRHQDPSERPFACDVAECGLKFWTSSQLKNHVQACHADHLSSATGASALDYPCTEVGCDMSFHKRKQLRQHIREQHSNSSTPQLRSEAMLADQDQKGTSPFETQPFLCPYPGCDRRFSTNSKRKTHYRTHEDGRYTCLMDHKHAQHAELGGQRPFIYTFPTWSALQAHMKEAHPPLCPWPGCGKQFQRQDNLRAHYRRHESRKLRLEMESKMLEGDRENDLNHLRAEMSDHSYASTSEEEDDAQSRQQYMSAGQTHFGGSSSSSSHLLSEEQLIQRAAQLSSTRPRRGGVFRDLASPALSIVTSSSGKTGCTRPRSVSTSITSARGAPTAFACTWNACSKVFTRKSTLSIHVRTAHLGERPFECTDCGRRFAHKHLVSRHHRVCNGTRSSSEGAANAGSRLRFSTSADHGQRDGGGRMNAAARDTDLDDSSTVFSVTESDNDEDADAVISPARAAKGSSSTVKPRLLDLLTGRGYSLTDGDPAAPEYSVPSKRPDSDEGETAVKRRRSTRGRLFACPWAEICHELDRQTHPTKSHWNHGCDQDGVTLEMQVDENSHTTPVCEHRSTRLYDLRRHFRAEHGLDLTIDELSAITHRTSWTHVQ